MNHGMNQPACMLLQRLLLLRACMRACVAACVIDTMYQLIHTRRILLPKLALLSGLILLEYFYTKIPFSTPALSALLSLAGQIYLS